MADDAMQGAIGYFIYGAACKQFASKDTVSASLPSHIQITHGWARNYSPDDLCKAMERCFEPYHARVSLIAIIGAFEGALLRFASRIAEVDKTFKAQRGNTRSILSGRFLLCSSHHMVTSKCESESQTSVWTSTMLDAFEIYGCTTTVFLILYTKRMAYVYTVARRSSPSSTSSRFRRDGAKEYRSYFRRTDSIH